MKTYGMLALAVLGAGTLFCAGGSAKVAPQGSGLRPTNAELYILSQSCFQGEVVPCG